MVLSSWVLFSQLDYCILRDGEEGGGEAKTNVGKLKVEPKEPIRI